MSTVATTTDNKHASWCEDTRPGEDREHICIAGGLTLDQVDVDTLEEIDLYVSVLSRPSERGVTIDVADIQHGELRLRPSHARSLAAALVRLADLAEHGR